MATSTTQKKAAKKNTTQTTLVAVVLDETGSMGNITSDTTGAVNDYFESLAKDVPDALVSLMQFSDSFGTEPKFRVAFKATKAKSAPKVTAASYRPRGNTPLYDAIGKAITETEGQEADRYLLVVLTDGLENASTEWTLDGVRDLIKRKEGEGTWSVVYLGANQDSWAVGNSLGVSPGNTMNYAVTPDGVRLTTTGLTRATSVYAASSAAASADFFGDAGQSAKDYDPTATPTAPKGQPKQPTAAKETPLW